jgi:hypothetical protein
MLSKKIVKYIQSLSHKKFRDEEGALQKKRGFWIMDFY